MFEIAIFVFYAEEQGTFTYKHPFNPQNFKNQLQV